VTGGASLHDLGNAALVMRGCQYGIMDRESRDVLLGAGFHDIPSDVAVSPRETDTMSAWRYSAIGASSDDPAITQANTNRGEG
jgi:hypothetical protein